MNPPDGQAPLDYLNQIAPQAPKKPLLELNLRTVIFGAIILVVLVIIISIVANAFGNTRKEPWERLSARLDTTATIAEDATTKIKSSQLRSLNSSLKLYLTDTRRDLTQYLTAYDINAEKISPSILAEESGDQALAKLEDGRLNAKYDTTYAREMGYQLATLVALLEQLSQSAPSDSQAFIQTAHDNLVPTYKAIESFDTANE